jgi:hypothetical protein
MRERPVTIRRAASTDAVLLQRLARLDSAAPLPGPVLLAESGGVPIAAISLNTGLVAADPSEHTAASVQLLRLLQHELVRRNGGRLDQARRRPLPDPAV